MHSKVCLAVIAVLFPTACATGGGPAHGGTLAYDVPSPPTATYHFADTMVGTVTSPIGDVEVEVGTALTLGMAFERAATGVRVSGEVIAFHATMKNPMTGSTSTDGDDVEGSLDFVMGRRGDVEVTSVPELLGRAAQMSPFISIAHEFFPRLPDRAVEPGDSWVDTVSWSADSAEGETTSTTVYTYTLVGDTLVGGVALLNISVSGDRETESSGSQGGMSMTQSLTGSTTGAVLWNADRGLPESAELERSLEGTIATSGMAPFSMTVTGSSRVRLEN